MSLIAKVSTRILTINLLADSVGSNIGSIDCNKSKLVSCAGVVPYVNTVCNYVTNLVH